MGGPRVVWAGLVNGYSVVVERCGPPREFVVRVDGRECSALLDVDVSAQVGERDEGREVARAARAYAWFLPSGYGTARP